MDMFPGFEGQPGDTGDGETTDEAGNVYHPDGQLKREALDPELAAVLVRVQKVHPTEPPNYQMALARIELAQTKGAKQREAKQKNH